MNVKILCKSEQSEPLDLQTFFGIHITSIQYNIYTHFTYCGNLDTKYSYALASLLRCLCPHLAGVDRNGDEGGLREELGGSQQVADALVISLVLLHRLHMHLLFGQQCLVARRVTSGWQELEISVASTQQEADPEMRHYITQCDIMF